MVTSMRHPFRSCIAPVLADLAALAAATVKAVPDPADRQAAVHRVMLAYGHSINREGV